MKKPLVLILSAVLAGCDTSGIGLFMSSSSMVPASPSSPSAPSATSAGDSGPALSADPARLAASLVCAGDFAGRAPVLLVHGTAVDVANDYGWNYVPVFTAMGVPYCTVQLLENATADIQDSAEYVVYAIREMFRLSGGRKIHIIGHSQGGMIPRWALRFWPDTRDKVDDLIGMAASNHGTVVALPFCPPLRGCAAAIWQQQPGSNFITALNADFETFDNISYTSIYTTFDEIVVPNLPLTTATSSTSLTGGDNVVNLATQEICPNDTSEHLGIGTYDTAAFYAAMDAIEHDGPAVLDRIPIEVCVEPFMPGVNPATFAADFAGVGQVIAQSLAAAPALPQEPPLKCYVNNSC